MSDEAQVDGLAEAPPSTYEHPTENGSGAGHTAEPPPPGAPAAEAAPQPGRMRRPGLRRLVIPVIAVVVVVAAFVGGRAYLDNLWYVSTDNAQVAGTPVPAGVLNPGRVEAINVQVGSQVHKADVLARVALSTVVSSAAVREDVRAPFDGVVIAVPVGVGATVSPGQGIVVLVDPSSLYVNANIDESKIGRVQIGQPVDVHVDALNSTLRGQVQAITDASAATFSLLPSQNSSSGSFTKVAQLVPVQISVDLSNQPLLVGTSVEVAIHVAPGH
jgi:multidrug resistance efflux pump